MCKFQGERQTVIACNDLEGTPDEMFRTPHHQRRGKKAWGADTSPELQGRIKKQLQGRATGTKFSDREAAEYKDMCRKRRTAHVWGSQASHEGKLRDAHLAHFQCQSVA